MDNSIGVHHRNKKPIKIFLVVCTFWSQNLFDQLLTNKRAYRLAWMLPSDDNNTFLYIITDISNLTFLFWYSRLPNFLKIIILIFDILSIKLCLFFNNLNHIDLIICLTFANWLNLYIPFIRDNNVGVFVAVLEGVWRFVQMGRVGWTRKRSWSRVWVFYIFE